MFFLLNSKVQLLIVYSSPGDKGILGFFVFCVVPPSLPMFVPSLSCAAIVFGSEFRSVCQRCGIATDFKNLYLKKKTNPLLYVL